MKVDANELEVNGVRYVRADSSLEFDDSKTPYVVVRGDRSGVQAGYLLSENGAEVELANARRLWYWDGAASCTQLAVDGTSKPSNCKFTKPIARIRIKDVIEVLPCTKRAKKSIEAVSEWSV